MLCRISLSATGMDKLKIVLSVFEDDVKYYMNSEIFLSFCLACTEPNTYVMF